MLYWVSHPDYDIPLPAGHRFAASKFSDLMQHLQQHGLADHARIITPDPVGHDALARVHDRGYIAAVADGTLDAPAQRVLGLPWSQALARRSFLAPSGTLLAACKALRHGLACHVAGGTHHAHHGHGAGFCVFNDLAYAATAVLDAGAAGRVLILDCDVHQGDGTARILADEPAVFTCSLHGARNYPVRKAESDLDVPLQAGLDSPGYLAVLAETLQQLEKLFRPDLVLYDAGVDIHLDDALGQLAVDDAGLRARDSMVLDHFLGRSIPVATVIGGGYSHDRQQLSWRHSQVFRAAISAWDRWLR